MTSLDEKLQLLPPPDVIDEKIKAKGIAWLQDAYTDLNNDINKSIDILHRTVDSIVRETLSKRANLVQLADINMHSSHTYIHSVNVSVLASLMGASCHLSAGDIKLLTLCGLMHDIGKLYISNDILDKPRALDDTEYMTMKTHPYLGAQRLKELGCFDNCIIRAAWEHHEHIDGTGYPRGLTGDKMHLYSKIIAICDVYDALTSTRPYKKAFRPNVAYGIMTTSQKNFDEKFMRAFFNNIAVYPVGTVMKTSLGYAVVKAIHLNHTLQPTLVVFADRHTLKLFRSPFEVDLVKFPDVIIEHVVSDNNLLYLIEQLGCDPAKYI